MAARSGAIVRRGSFGTKPALHRRRRLEQAPRTAGVVCPLWSRIFEVLPLRPAVVGAGIALALVVTFLGVDWIDGNLDPVIAGEASWWRHVEPRSALIHALLVAGLIVVHRYEELAARRDVLRLQPLLRLEEANPPALIRQVEAIDRSTLRSAGLIGSLAIAAIVPALYIDPGRFLQAETWTLPSVLFDLGVGAVFGWTLARVLYAALVQDRAFARLSQHVEKIDLLDLSPLRCFARRGLRRALRWLMLGSVACLVFIDAGFVALPAVVLLVIIGFGVFSFVLPVYGIHRRISAEKRQQLESLHGKIRSERARIDAVADDRRAGGRLADLLAYEARIAGAREWPIDVSHLLRFALYLLLPLCSWLGGAFVEHVVDAALG